jgi:hypothetical protein
MAMVLITHFYFTSLEVYGDEKVNVTVAPFTKHIKIFLYSPSVQFIFLFQVVKHQEFLSLQVEQLSNLLKSDDLNVVTEENVFESLMNWVQHDNANREQHLPSLLKLIKLPLLSSEVLN